LGCDQKAMSVRALITGIAALFLATGTVAAVEQNWEMSIVLKEPGKEPMLYRDMMMTRENCSQILSDARSQMAESRLPPVTITPPTGGPPVTGEPLAIYCHAPDGTWTGAESPRFGFIKNADGTTSFYDKAERGGAAAEVGTNELSRQFDALLDEGRVLKCGDIKIFKLPDGKVGSNRQGESLNITADDNNIYLDGKACMLCDQSASC
jgi:hypothetical protein